MREASKDRGERDFDFQRVVLQEELFAIICRYRVYHEILTLAKKQQNQKTGFTLLFMYINIVKI